MPLPQQFYPSSLLDNYVAQESEYNTYNMSATSPVASAHSHPRDPVPPGTETTLGPRFYGKLPNLNWAQAFPPSAIAMTKRREDDMRTAPFSKSELPYTDEDIPLPTPYNAAFPHPLTAYVSPGVNMTGKVRKEWQKKLQDMLKLDPSLVKGSILASSDTLPPALTVPMFDGEGCAIPERLWCHIERADDATTSINLVATPGGRPRPSAFAPIRTNFSNVLRRESKPKGYKVEMCKEWQRMGRCPYERDCVHAHGLMELRHDPRPMPTQTPTIPIPPRHLVRARASPTLVLDDQSYASSVSSLSPVTPTFGSIRSMSSRSSWEDFNLADGPDMTKVNMLMTPTSKSVDDDRAAAMLASDATRNIWN